MTKSNWKRYKLGDVVGIKGGKRLPAGHALVNYVTEHPYLRVRDLTQRFPIKEDIEYITEETFSHISRYIIKENDVVLSIVGSIGLVAFINQNLNDVSLTENAVRLFTTKVYPLFLYYYLLSPVGQAEIAKNTVGAVQAKLPIYGIQNIDIFLPLLEEQKRIAEILGAFDDKIELLQKQNKTLEEMAKAIFKSWFVDFDIVKAKQKGEKKEDIIKNYHLTEELYNLFPSSFVDSSLGPIPTGWEVKSLTDFLEFEKGIEPGAKNYTTECVIGSSLPFYRVQDIVPYGNKSKTFVSIELLKGKVFSEEDILVSFDATLGRVFLGAKGGFSSGIRKIIVNNPDLSKIYILCFLKSDYFLQMLDKYAGAETTIKHAGKAINYLQIVYCQTVFKKFNEVLDNYFSKILNNIKQIQTLTELRDTLLPRLISGKIRV